MDDKTFLNLLKQMHDRTTIPEESKVYSRAYSLFSIDNISVASRKDVWYRFSDGVDKVCRHMGPVLTAMPKKYGNRIGAVDWSQAHYLTTDVRSALTMMVRDGIEHPVFMTESERNDGMRRLDAWTGAIDKVSTLMRCLDDEKKDFVPLAFWAPQGWTGLLEPNGDDAIRRMMETRNAPRDAKAVWSDISDVPVTYTSPDNLAQASSIRTEYPHGMQYIVPDPYLVQRFVETELEAQIRKGGWKGNNEMSGGMTFLTGFKRFLSAPYADGEAVVNLFYNIYSGSLLLDSPAFMTSSGPMPGVSVYNVIQKLLRSDELSILAPDVEVFTPNTSCLVRLLNDSRCLPSSKQDTVRHERLHGWFNMKNYVEAEVMRLRGITSPSEVIQVQIPTCRSEFTLTWDRYFSRIIEKN